MVYMVSTSLHYKLLTLICHWRLHQRNRTTQNVLKGIIHLQNLKKLSQPKDKTDNAMQSMKHYNITISNFKIYSCTKLSQVSANRRNCDYRIHLVEVKWNNEFLQMTSPKFLRSKKNKVCNHYNQNKPFSTIRKKS